MASSSISFKSVGNSVTTISTRIERSIVRTPLGIQTPLKRGSATLFEMHYDVLDMVRDNLKNLILTNHGERIGLFDFGANLNELSTERVSMEDYDSEVAQRIATAVAKWMPYVTLDELLPLDRPDDPLRSRGNVPLRRYLVTYEVPAVDQSKQSLEVVIGMA